MLSLPIVQLMADMVGVLDGVGVGVGDGVGVAVGVGAGVTVGVGDGVGVLVGTDSDTGETELKLTGPQF